MPNLLGAVVVLIVGWILAVFISRVILKAFKLLRFEFVAQRLRLNDFLTEGGIQMTALEVVHKIIYWLLMFCVILMTCDVLGMKVAALLLERFVVFIPNAVIAIVVLLAGAFMARVAQSGLVAYLKNIGIGKAEALGKVVQYAILIFAAGVSLEQLQIGGEIIRDAFKLAFGSVCLAFGLAFGLGGREWAAGILQKLSHKK